MPVSSREGLVRDQIGGFASLREPARDVFRDSTRDLALVHDDEVCAERLEVLDLLVGVRARSDGTTVIKKAQ
jgi:hypothetical protein